ncbi:MAG: hypothetical protein P0Y53_16660 [Candidatus Pseudobacter hemicellulosilyticus]|uniref:Calcineurin-like phosphoesterase domain-containing protein n=1 Tax=Candidatus Pseudobacter hemicellulosilyticus TaxID=3121375 RepID=A0AAJ5WLH9_9BACT|nr:MAG: hypothetical protein P0Y53_16660 [Pseudobacter sp.]
MKRITQMLALLLLLTGSSQGQQQPISFIACGDMPYNNPADIIRFRRLTQQINAFQPAFAIHVGDIKNGATPCTTTYMDSIKNLFMQFEGPLLYTPGDNEWTDCDRPAAGSYNPMERLAALRKLFYNGHTSLGKKPLPVMSQHRLRGYEDFVENQYWTMEGVSFGSFHAVGTNNHLVADPARAGEFFHRDSANCAWINYVFDQAVSQQHRAVVLFTQADINFEPKLYSGFFHLVNTLRRRVQQFNGPVLLVYGDSHRFKVEKPLKDAAGKLLLNFTSCMVFGEEDVQGVRIDIWPGKGNIFSISEFLVEGN